MSNNIFALKGNILYSESDNQILSFSDHYLICENGKSQGVFRELPEMYKNVEVQDFGDALIVPGLIDLHLHAPQFSFRGLYMDLELLDWLNTSTFPEEAKYMDIDYADKAYDLFCRSLTHSATTRANIFATLHEQSSYLLMQKLEDAGMRGNVGKVNMDRNSPMDLCESSAQEAIETTERWIQQSFKRFSNIKPIITPRFTPSCTDELMQGLSDLQTKYKLPIQSHLSENPSETAWVKELCPDCKNYAQSYDRYAMLGEQNLSVMAHCVHLEQDEIELLKQRGTFIAHCPQSNTNLSSGIAPVRQFLNQSLRVGLGSDIAGGHSLSIFRAMSDAIQASKLYWRLIDQDLKPLGICEVFYLATKGGGAFFGKVGSFEKGYEFDAIVLDDSALEGVQKLDPLLRLERYTYLSEEAKLLSKYIAGKRLW